MDALKKVFSILSFSEKLSFITIFIFILIVSILETFSVALVLPAIKFLISDNFVNEVIIFFKNYFSLDVDKASIIVFGLLFILFFFIFKFFFVAITHYLQLKYLLGLLVTKCNFLYQGYLSMGYEEYTKTQSPILIRNVSILVDKFNSTIQNCFTIFTDFFLFIGVVGLLVYYDSKSTFFIFVIFLFLSLAYYFGTRTKFYSWGDKATKIESKKLKFLYEGIFSIKEIKLSNSINYFVKEYSNSVFIHGRLSLLRNFIKSLPKMSYELLAVISLVVIGLTFISEKKSLDEFIPISGVFAVAAFKILPAGNRILLAFQNLLFDLASLNILNTEISKIKKDKLILSYNENIPKFSFNSEIKISNVDFAYESSGRKILSNINLIIKKNSTIGIIGESGAGKSTLMDIMIGLLKPTSGFVTCDGIDINTNISSWHKTLGYVPQNINLLDDTIASNVAFGIDKNQIDTDRVFECISLSRLETFVKNSDYGIMTNVGERGIKLSGGQIQRIGVARSLYKKPDILFFDESTSSLDVKTEEDMMKSVNELLKNITKIIISHRIVTLKNCDVIYYLKNGTIYDFGDYQKMSKIKYD